MKNPFQPQESLPDGWQAWPDHDLASHVLANSPDVLQRSLAVRLFNHAHELARVTTERDEAMADLQRANGKIADLEEKLRTIKDDAGWLAQPGERPE